jgi:hypothetical protein
MRAMWRWIAMIAAPAAASITDPPGHASVEEQLGRASSLPWP